MDRAAIFSADGTSVWATSASFTVTPQEMQEVVAAYKDKGDPATGVKQVQASGLHIAGERFVVIKADERSVYGKKVRLIARFWRASRSGWGCGSAGEGEGWLESCRIEGWWS